jgi:hypothetical protein
MCLWLHDFLRARAATSHHSRTIREYISLARAGAVSTIFLNTGYNTGSSFCTVLEKRTVNPGTGKFSLPVPVKSTGVQLILVLPQTEKS